MSDVATPAAISASARKCHRDGAGAVSEAEMAVISARYLPRLMPSRRRCRFAAAGAGASTLVIAAAACHANDALNIAAGHRPVGRAR